MLLDQCIVGDCRDVMADLIVRGVKVQTVVTSPPYWGLRDYGTGEWDGGAEGCDHARQLGGTNSSTLHHWDNGLNAATIGEKVTSYGRASYRDRCGKCGARRVDRQLGLERDPVRYLARMRSVFRLVWDLLADDGTLWLNMGDSYNSPCANGGVGCNSTINGQRTQEAFRRASRVMKSRIQPPDVDGPNRRRQHGLKEKDLVGMPWALAFVLRSDGWYLRSDVIWHKANPMPESVNDRPTKAHEYLFLLTKSPRYYYDADAIKEPASENTHPRGTGVNPKARIPTGWDTGDGGHRAKVGRYRSRQNESFSGSVSEVVAYRNKRTVWSVQTQPFPGAHFATFPEKLIEPCILAGSRPGDIVFDPFMGAGTVGAVASRLGRRWLGAELNPAYVELQKPRVAQQGMPL